MIYQVRRSGRKYNMKIKDHLARKMKMCSSFVLFWKKLHFVVCSFKLLVEGLIVFQILLQLEKNKVIRCWFTKYLNVFQKMDRDDKWNDSAPGSQE